MPGLALIVAQYELQGNARRTEHWSLAVLKPSRFEFAEIFQIKGNKDTFEFEHKTISRINRSRTYLGGVLVGYVHPSQLGDFEAWLRAVPIYKYRNDWDCQNWVLDSLRTLRLDQRGIVLPGRASESFIRARLAEEKEREETGHDLVDDRLKAGFRE